MIQNNYMIGQPQEKINIVWGYNEMIAHYMGYKYFPLNENNKINCGWKIHENVSSTSKLNINQNDYLCRSVKGMSYHYDWNWLMPVVYEIYKRHGYYIHLIGNVACSIYKEDLEQPISVANAGPKFFNISYTAKNNEEMIMVMWKCVAETIVFILKNYDPKIPLTENYNTKFENLKNIKL